ncbi:beta-ketoacyl-ACP synthase [Rhodoferax sp.]|uniref:beta-ketoacyl-ACP synthase n=1 Tax=Rhodoferax sp. TaxID=50421 RepID=UPI00374D1EE9
MNIFLQAVGVVCALGSDLPTIRSRMWATQMPESVAPTDQYTPGRVLHLGRVQAQLPALAQVPLQQRSRHNALLAQALQDIRGPAQAALARYGPSRIAVVLGGSAPGLEEGEHAVRYRKAHGAWPPGYDYAQQTLGSGAAFVARELGATGPAYTISTACSSGAKALASAARLLRAGYVDAVVAGGADALSAFTIAGFSALESVSAERCNPMSLHRCGINLGEGAALFLVTRDSGPVRLAGWGETSDAHHMSAPEPSGQGAADAMAQALARAGVAARAVDYLNLHGTATVQNDAMESRAVAAVLGCEIPVSATKPMTGHALAAAGAIEAALAWATLVDNPHGHLPPHWFDGARDPALSALHLVQPGTSLGRLPRYVLSNSFAFGGSNAALLFAQA